MLVPWRGVRPVATLIVRLETPTGTLPGRERSWRPSARLVLGWGLPGHIAMHSNVGIAHETAAGRAFARERPGGETTRYAHGGVTLLIRPWMHADLHGGLGSRSAGSPRWIGVGIRRRVGW
ncbi:MAG: hypothetical protein ABIY46_08490 [Gemmatimonadales bacterium]